MPKRKICWKIAQLIVYFPYLCVLGGIQIASPIRIEKIPLLQKKILENWIINPLPSWYLILVKQAINLAVCISLYYTFFTNTTFLNNNPHLSYEHIKQFRNRTSFLVYIYYCSLAMMIIYCTLNIVYFIEWIHSNLKEENLIIEDLPSSIYSPKFEKKEVEIYEEE